MTPPDATPTERAQSWTDDRGRLLESGPLSRALDATDDVMMERGHRLGSYSNEEYAAVLRPLLDAERAARTPEGEAIDDLEERLAIALAEADDAGSDADDWRGSEYVMRIAASVRAARAEPGLREAADEAAGLLARYLWDGDTNAGGDDAFVEAAHDKLRAALEAPGEPQEGER